MAQYRVIKDYGQFPPANQTTMPGNVFLNVKKGDTVEGTETTGYRYSILDNAQTLMAVKKELERGIQILKPNPSTGRTDLKFFIPMDCVEKVATRQTQYESEQKETTKTKIGLFGEKPLSTTTKVVLIVLGITIGILIILKVKKVI